MRWFKMLSLSAVLAAGLFSSGHVAAGAYVRQYYGPWTYSNSNGYYYRYYYYKPYVSYDSYDSHYCVYYVARPRYVYYYNPYRKVYWGRFDTEAKGDNKYSLLADKDRKEKLDDIPEKAFPEPAKMPVIPEAKDTVAIEPPPGDLPKK